MPDRSVQCCITSPPYWGLRSYLPRNHPMKHLEIGSEPTVEEWVGKLVVIFREVHRVLRNDGTLWLNLGDSYAGSRCGGTSSSTTPRNPGQKIDQSAAAKAQQREMIKSRQREHRPQVPRSDIRMPGLKPKDLVGQPWPLAFALRADGWFLRDEIIWHKRNPMPENVRDRFTKAHEQVFLLSKRQRYYFDRTHIQEPVTGGANARGPGNKKVPSGWDTGPGGHREGTGRYAAGVNPKARAGRDTAGRQNASFSAAITGAVVPTRNARNVISLTTEPFKGAHFATFPPKLIEPFVLVGCPPGGTVLDIFGGSGTTGLGSDRHHRHSILIELDPSAAVLAKHRIERESPLFSDVSVTRIEDPCPS